MKFRIGQMFIQISLRKEAVIVVPVGDHMIAVHLDMFDMMDFNSIRVVTEIYHKEDKRVKNTVELWLKEIGE